MPTNEIVTHADRVNNYIKDCDLILKYLKNTATYQTTHGNNQTTHGNNQMMVSDRLSYIVTDVNIDDSINTILLLKDLLSEKKDKPISDNFYQAIYNICNAILQNILSFIKENETHLSNPKFLLDAPSEIKTMFSNISLDMNTKIKSDVPIIRLLYTLGYNSQNIVIVGANGSGKSYLTTLFKSIGNYYQEKGYIVIPAFRDLNLSALSVFKKSIVAYSPMKESKRGAIGNEFSGVFSTIIEDNFAVGIKFFSEYKNGTEATKPISLFNDVIKIWNEIMGGHRTLTFIDGDPCTLEVKNEDTKASYKIQSMSDGEKNILYLVSMVLLTPPNQFILVDEPELYLHKTIIDKLWNTLENIRKDCQFIYLTHDVDFAVSRDATKMWIKEFTYPNIWDIKEIEGNDIPQELLLSLVGSRKSILFCEGEKESRDIKWYELIFPEFTIAPVKSCKDVINCTKAFNKSGIMNTVAYGLIDTDQRCLGQKDSLPKELIFTLAFSEIENVLLDATLLEKVGEICHILELPTAISNIKNKIFKAIKSDKEMLITRYIASKIEYEFKERHLTGNTKADIQKAFNDFTSSIKIDNLYDDKEKDIDKIIANKDYQETIKQYNNKNMIDKIIKEEFRITDYEKQVFDYIAKNPEIRESLQKKIAPELFAKYCINNSPLKKLPIT